MKKRKKSLARTLLDKKNRRDKYKKMIRKIGEEKKK